MSEPPPRRGLAARAKTVLFATLTVLVTTAAMLLLAEAGLRLFTDWGHTLLVKDEVVGQRFRRGFEGARLVREAGREVGLRFNREGYRGPDRPRAKPPGSRRLLVLGDSTVAAVGVDEDDTMVAQLEQRLNAGGGAPWEVLNFGVSGFSTAQSLLTWRHYASAYEPDQVILVFTVRNDLADNHGGASSAHRPYFDLDRSGELRLLPMSAARAGLSRWLDAHSRLYVWQKDVTSRARHALFKRAGALTPGMQILNREPPPEIVQAWRITEALLARFRDEVEASGATFLVVIVPMGVQVRDDLWRELTETLDPALAATLERELPQRRLAEVLDRRGVRWLSLLPAFREAAGEQPLAYLGGRGHWNERGNHLAARVVHRYLAQGGMAQGGMDGGRRP